MSDIKVLMLKEIDALYDKYKEAKDREIQWACACLVILSSVLLLGNGYSLIRLCDAMKIGGQRELYLVDRLKNINYNSKR